MSRSHRPLIKPYEIGYIIGRGIANFSLIIGCRYVGSLGAFLCATAGIVAGEENTLPSSTFYDSQSQMQFPSIVWCPRIAYSGKGRKGPKRAQNQP